MSLEIHSSSLAVRYKSGVDFEARDLVTEFFIKRNLHFHSSYMIKVAGVQSFYIQALYILPCLCPLGRLTSFPDRQCPAMCDI